MMHIYQIFPGLTPVTERMEVTYIPYLNTNLNLHNDSILRNIKVRGCVQIVGEAHAPNFHPENLTFQTINIF